MSSTNPLIEALDNLAVRCGFPRVENLIQLTETVGNLVERQRDELEKLRAPADDDEAIDETWLTAMGFDTRSLRMTKVLPTPRNGQVVEMGLTPNDSPIGDEWTVSLNQGDGGFDDDHVALTSIFLTKRGELRRLLAALGVPV